MSTSRLLGKLFDGRGHPIPCDHCDQHAVIEWHGERLCGRHFDLDGQSKVRAALRRSRLISLATSPELDCTDLAAYRIRPPSQPVRITVAGEGDSR